MRVEWVKRTMNGQRLIHRESMESDVISGMYGALHFSWLPRFITELQKQTVWSISHPQGKEWYAVFWLDYQPGALATGRLFIRPALISGRLMPYIPLAAHRTLTVNIVTYYLERFVSEATSQS